MFRKIIFWVLLLSCGPSFAVDDAFFSQSQTTVTLINEYIRLIDDAKPDYTYYDMTSWAQAASIDFQSGFFDDWLGADVSAYGVHPLKAAEGFETRGFFDTETDSNGDVEAKGFVKLPRYRLKQKFNVGTYDLKLYEGMHTLDDFGSLGSEERIVDSSYYGIISTMENSDWLFKAGYLTRYSDTDMPNKEKLETADGQALDYVYTADATFKGEGYALRYYLGESQDYLRQHVFNIETDIGQGKRLTARLFYNHGLSKWKSMSESAQPYDSDAMHFSLETRLFYPKWFVLLAYTYTDADRSTSLGKFDWDLSADSSGNRNSMADALSTDFTNDGEHMVAVLALRDITPSIKAGFIGRYGFGIEYEGNHMNESEFGLLGSWTPQAIDGLSLNLGGGPNYSFKRSFTNTPLLDSDGDWEKSKGYCFTFSLKYQL